VTEKIQNQLYNEFVIAQEFQIVPAFAIDLSHVECVRQGLKWQRPLPHEVFPIDTKDPELTELHSLEQSIN